MHELLVCSPPFPIRLWELSSRQVAAGAGQRVGGRQIDSARDSQSDRECAALGSLAYATSQSAAALTDARGRSQQQSNAERVAKWRERE